MQLRSLQVRLRNFLLGGVACAGLLLAGCVVKGGNGNSNTNANGNANENDNGTTTPIRVEVTIAGEGQVVQNASGSMVTLTATPAMDWVFERWTGAVESTDNPVTVDAAGGAAVTATFTQAAPAPDGDGDGVVDADDDCPGTPIGSEVTPNGCAASQLDDDGDGISNSLDICPNTAAGATVNASGCEMTDADRDGDGVPNADDDCANTPPGTPVDANGCPLVVPPTDADGDGVADAADNCPGTPAGTLVDAVGCPLPDADGDGITDPNDDCPATPAGQPVNASGCSAAQRDTDGDGVTDAADLCPGTRPGTIVDPNGCIAGTPPPPPPPPPPVETLDNDACQTPMQVTDGVISFTTLTATTDGPQDTGVCSIIEFEADAWFCYTATCDDLATVSLCSTAFDSTVAIYEGCGCPTTEALTCDDDFCAASGAPRVRFAVEAGQSYMIRVGGYDGITGNGVLDISCAPAPDLPTLCQAATGACDVAHAGTGCEDDACCETICEIDSYCCEIQWDQLCSEEADAACNGKFPVCNTSEDACDSVHSDPGCASDGCCLQVCNADPYCCLVEWDESCVERAENCQN